MLFQTLKNTRLKLHAILFFADSISYFYLILKIFRVLCFSKLTFDQIPLFNPYKWPFSFIRIVTKPYFEFWSQVLPNLRFGSSSYDISSIIGLEMLSTLITLLYKIRLIILMAAKKIILNNN